MKTEKLPRAKLNADTLFAGRTKLDNPTLWQGGRTAPVIDNPINERRLRAAANEVHLLELIAAYPGKTSGWYAKRIQRATGWTHTTLLKYAKDEIVRFEMSPAYHWYLNHDS